MWEAKTGYCPVHDRNITIEVKYANGHVVGEKGAQRKIVSDRCEVWDHSKKECANCPIAHGPPMNTP